MTELSFAFTVNALCHLMRGELNEAAELVTEGLEVLGRTDSAIPSTSLMAVGGRVAALQGLPERAQALLGESLELCEQAHNHFYACWVRMMIGDAQLARGDLDAAVGSLEEARRGRESRRLLPEFLVEIYPLLAVAYLERWWRDSGGAGRVSGPSRRRLEAVAKQALVLTRRRPHYRAPALRVAATMDWLDGGYPVSLAAVHDATHVLGGFDTTHVGELLVSAFESGASPTRWVDYWVGGMLFCQLGFPLEPGAAAALGQFPPERFYEAFTRGVATSAVVIDPDWDFWPLTDLPRTRGSAAASRLRVAVSALAIAHDRGRMITRRDQNADCQ